MMTTVIPDNLFARVDFVDFWEAWTDGAEFETMSIADLHEAKDTLLDANVPYATAAAYFRRLAGFVASPDGGEWEHQREIEFIVDELYRAEVVEAMEF